MPAHAVDEVREGEPVRRVPPAARRLVRRIHGGVGVAVCREPQEPCQRSRVQRRHGSGAAYR